MVFYCRQPKIHSVGVVCYACFLRRDVFCCFSVIFFNSIALNYYYFLDK